MSQAATPGPTRRSARIGSVARSAASQSGVTMVARDTPKETPVRRRALPKLKSRQSTAYGASGRIGAAQELSITQTGFSEAFEIQREAAIARNSEERRMSGSRDGGAARSSPSRNSDRDPASQLDYESEEPPSEEEDEEQDEEEISAETSKSFGMGHEAGMLRQPVPQSRTPLVSRKGPAATTGAALSGLRRPLENLVGDHKEPERRVPPVRPVTASLPEKPSYVPSRGPVAGATTPRILGTRPAPASSAGGPSPRVPTVRTAQESVAGSRQTYVHPVQGSRAGGYSPRTPADRLVQGPDSGSSYRTANLRPNQVPNGTGGAPGSSQSRAIPESESESEVAPGMKFLDSIRSYPWHYYALAFLAVILASVLAYTATGSPPTAPLSDGWESLSGWFTPRTSPMIPVDQNLKARVDEVELGLKDIQSFIHSLGDEVPEYVVVSRSPSGTINVSKDFWDAIISRIRKEGPSIEWDTFVQSNQERLKSALGAESAVIREDLFKAMDNNFNNIAEDFDRKLDFHTQSMVKEVQKQAAKEAKKVAIEHARLRSMALSNLIATLELQYGTPNYFSPGLGARILSSITSPALVPDKAPLMRVLQRVFTPVSNTATIALQPWEEPGDCWCAAPDETRTGKAQLGIELGEPMLPSQITLEHLPLGSAPGRDISSAPRDVELWVKSDEPALVRFAFDGERCEPGPDGWQCLGRVKYDITGANHVQTFLLDGEAQTPVKHVMLRVTSNWGADHTCIYRARLHGKGFRPVTEYEGLQ